MPCLSEHEQSGTIAMLNAGVRVSDITRYDNCRPLTMQHLRDCYQATRTVKDRCRSGQPRIANGVKRQLTFIVYLRYLHRRYPFRQVTGSARPIVGLQG